MWVLSLKNSLVLKMRASGIYHCVLFIAIFPFKPAPKPHYFSEDHSDLFKIHPDPPTSFPSSFAYFCPTFHLLTGRTTLWPAIQLASCEVTQPDETGPW